LAEEDGLNNLIAGKTKDGKGKDDMDKKSTEKGAVGNQNEEEKTKSHRIIRYDEM
jgi:hypothetical protein